MAETFAQKLFLRSLTCTYLVLSALCPVENLVKYLVRGSPKAPLWHSLDLLGYSVNEERIHSKYWLQKKAKRYNILAASLSTDYSQH